MSWNFIKSLFFPILFLFFASPAYALDIVRPITFPVNGDYTYRDDWHEPRGGGTRLHMGNDVIAAKMTPLVAAVDGVISFVARPQASWGYEIEIQGDDGYFYDYLHMNNDNPGTDDGQGGEAQAYVAGAFRGARVTKGQLIGWVGDSGNAEDTVSHLHFEIHDPSRVAFDPFPSLYAASGGKGVSANAPRPTSVDSTTERERLIDLRYVFTKDLGVGVTSNEVKQLQRVLRTLGYFTFPSNTGYFGTVTETSVKNFQKKMGITPVGRLGIETRRKLNAELGTYDPNDYQPFYTPAEQAAIELQRKQQQAAIEAARLKAIRGY